MPARKKKAGKAGRATVRRAPAVTEKSKSAELARQLAEARTRQAATAEILRVIARSRSDVQPVFEAIVRTLRRLFGTRFSVLQILHGDMVEMPAVDGVGIEKLRERYPRPIDETTVGGRAMLTKQPVQFAPVLDNPATPEATIQFAKDFGFNSVIFTPMLHEGRVIGAIGAARSAAKPFDERQTALIQTFADQAVIAIENVRLFNETKEALERQTASGEVLSVISGSISDPKPVFERILAICERLFAGYQVGINVIGGDGQIYSGAYRGPGRERFENVFPLPVSEESGTGAAIVHGRVMHYPDVEHGPNVPRGTREGCAATGVKSVIFAPMIIEEGPLGAIFVGRRAAIPFTEREFELLQSFASQAAIAIKNARLFNETKEALERQTATGEILKAISGSTTDTQPVFDAIVQSGMRLFPNSAVAVVLREGAMVQLAAIGGRNADRIRQRFPFPLSREFMHGAAILDGAMVEVADARTYSEGPMLAGVRNFHASGSLALTIMPMLQGGKAIGAISVNREHAGALVEEQIALLRTFADQAVIAIENVRLFNETKEALERQTATAEILEVISRSTTVVDPALESIVQSASRLFGCSAGIQMLEGGKIFLRAAWSPTHGKSLLPEMQKHYPLEHDPDKRVASRVIARQEVVQIADTEDAGVPATVQAIARSGKFRSIVLVPMLKEGAGIGVLSLTHDEPGLALSTDQIELLKTFASQAVIAIENVRLFNETKESLERLEATADVLKVISRSPTDVQPVFDAIAQRAAILCGARFCTLTRFDGELIHMAAVHGTSPEVASQVGRAYPMKPGSGTLAARVIRDGRALHIADVTSDPDYVAKEAASAAGFRSVLGVPMMREGQFTGAIVIAREQAGLFPENQVDLLATFADQAVIAIENVRLFHEIEEKGRQLEVASRHKSDFLASMSHELRTPLNAILGFNEMILSEVYGAVPADMQEPLRDIQTSGKHLLRLINNVLDLAKIEAGRMELALSDYSVQDTVASVHTTLRPLAAEKGLEFLASVPADVPLAHGDPGRITQCLMNLAGNSLKFTKQGRVEIAVAQRDGMLRYSVADTGIGIPADKIGSLFTEFKQTDATIASEFGGTGLGLSISKKFVEMQGGRIWVESEVGKGSTFFFEIPLRVGA